MENEMNQMRYGEDYKMIPATSVGSGVTQEVLPDVICHTIQIVNICIVENEETGEFVLIDAGMPHSYEEIIGVVEERYGEGARPSAIILTHGHFDHVGAIIELVNHWEVPVYAHHLEMPFLTGKQKYPDPDGSVEGGMVAKMSPMFPNDPIDLANNVEELPQDQSVPFLPEFKWIHTPGHAPGHVSFFRERDRLLIAGDAFVTVRQDELYKVYSQEAEINGPPRYLTPDWVSAKESVKKLASLKPAIAITGHGVPLMGEPLREGLEHLARYFDEVAKPDFGKYVDGTEH